MNTFKKVRRLIVTRPEVESSQTLSALVKALESESSFNLAALYQLDYDSFRLALELLADWRLDRYYNSRSRLVDAISNAAKTTK